MGNGAETVHRELREALADYIKSQYFGKSPLLLTALQKKLSEEGVLYKSPYIESSPAYQTVEDGIRKSKALPEWVKAFFCRLAEEKLGVYKAPFSHQVKALETAARGEDIFVATGTGSGKTECFMWPLLMKLAEEAKERKASWECRGVRAIIMYPMNALVSDQIGRLRRLLGDEGHKFRGIFREFCGEDARRPQFGMYTGRTPYPGATTQKEYDHRLEKTYRTILDSSSPEFLQKLSAEGKLPAKENLNTFLENLAVGNHVPDPEDAELVTRFEMQSCCPDILITNYSMLEYMLLRQQERNFWEDTKRWLAVSAENKLLFIIDEAHMYRGSAGGEVSYLLRRLFYRLGIDRDRVQFILTTASMPDRNEEDRKAVREFAEELSAGEGARFTYLTGDIETTTNVERYQFPFSRLEAVSPDDFEMPETREAALCSFWDGIPGFDRELSSEKAISRWMYAHLTEYEPFRQLLTLCRGTAVSLEELAAKVFVKEYTENPQQALHAAGVLIEVATLARSAEGSVLFPARMHMLFRGIKGVFACTNPNCLHASEGGGLRLGEVDVSGGRLVCPHCNSMMYELYNDRRCGALFLKGYVLKEDVEAHRNTYLWHETGLMADPLVEIHLYLPPKNYVLPKRQRQNKILPCYLDTQSGFLYFSDDSMEGKPGMLKLYYCTYSAKGQPEMCTFSKCPHCGHQLSRRQLTSFATRGNQSFFNLIKAQFQAEPPVSGKDHDPDRFPNEGRKVLLFSDSRQRAAKLARDMSDASDMTAARQLAAIALRQMEKDEATLDKLYGYFSLAAMEKHVHLFYGEEQKKLLQDGKQELQHRERKQRRGKPFKPEGTMDNAPNALKAQLLRFFCGGYNTFTDTAMSWLEPEEGALDNALDALSERDISVEEKDFLELFNAWMLWLCDSHAAVGHTIPDEIRELVRPSYTGYGLAPGWAFPQTMLDILGWKKGGTEAGIWKSVLQDAFLDEGNPAKGKYYVELRRVRPCFDESHPWHRCEKCSELTPYTLRGCCPSCGAKEIHELTADEKRALSFWSAPIEAALAGEPIRVIDTEEHTAQLSHKDQRADLWAQTEKYELRFQDFLQEGEAPVDILSSTTTMEVGIDIGSLVAVGLRNIPPMRENYQQRAGRAGRRGASLSTIVTYCEDGPHDSLYFENPVPMFRGDPRRPWIDTRSEKILQRHLSMAAFQLYLMEIKHLGMDEISAVDFFSKGLQDFFCYLKNFHLPEKSVLLPLSVKDADSYQAFLREGLSKLAKKVEAHPELFCSEAGIRKKKSLLDALYEEGLIPTYSFPKNVVSLYVQGPNGKTDYQVERGLDVAIGEYAPGRSLVVDKETYQVGGIYVPGGEYRREGPAASFMEDSNYLKEVKTCKECGWFGLPQDAESECPFCGSSKLTSMRRMLRRGGSLQGTEKRLHLRSWRKCIHRCSHHCIPQCLQRKIYTMSKGVRKFAWRCFLDSESS